MTDRQILSKLKLTDLEAKLLIHRVSRLKKSELEILGIARPDFSDAAKAMGGNCKPSDLQRFIRARSLKAPAAAFFFMAGDEDDD